MEDPNNNNPRNISLEIHQYQALEKILNDRKKCIWIIIAIFFITVAIFSGIAVVILSLKQFYPYNEIVTNVMGATTIKNENKEVSYWLFNTAELWADSGIKVKKGQTISVKVSGKKHSAIHHLVKDVYENSPTLREPWVGSEGFDPETRNKNLDKVNSRDSYRARYRICPGENQDALLMQVVKGNEKPRNRPSAEDGLYVIGKEKNDIHINEDGVLYFAINDIVLDDDTILKMMLEIKDGEDYSFSKYLEIINDNKHSDLKSIIEDIQDKNSNRARQSLEYTKLITALGDDVKTFNSKWKDSSSTNRFKFQATSSDKEQIELFGYLKNKYENAWYDDNVGSFLIIVESTKE